MNRNVTAVYRTYSVADLVRRELESMGISRANIHVIPDTGDAVGTTGYRDDRRWMDQLHDLHLPEEDVRTYQHSVRRGDYVVSSNVDDEYVQRVHLRGALTEIRVGVIPTCIDLNLYAHA